ncbi:MAG: PASTA domain-containing protein [Bacilli bacterium]|nr:PASTA domain-containing protein [Bacilli bacterium]
MIEALGIEKRDSQIEKNYNWNDKKYYEVPNVVGLSVKEANNELKNFEVEYSGTGENIVEQSPKAGERILEGEKVRLLLGE